MVAATLACYSIHMKFQLLFFLLFLSAFAPNLAFSVEEPAPYGVLPSERQLAWHNLEMYAFIHFTVNTFTDKEWGYGNEPESVFNPSEFDADQIVKTVKRAGLKGLILTAKHHDGFCLWPSKYSDHTIAHSPYKNGKGDIVKEISDASHREGILFGIYLSPWDRNHSQYGTPKYLDYYRNQLRELLTNYGSIFEIWFDGANGGDGWYGSADEMRKIDNKTYYDWDNTWSIVRELQPQAVIFSDGGPDARWCGNEKGYVKDPCWETINAAGNLPGNADPEHLQEGDAKGTHWMPAEVDVSIRPGWFYHRSEDNQVKSPEELYKIYFQSVGRGANLILNLAPDQRGIIPEKDVQHLIEWRTILKNTFDHNIATEAKVTASDTRGGDNAYGVGNLADNDGSTYWGTDDGVTTADLIFDFDDPQMINVISLSEYIALGQRIRKVFVDAWDESTLTWKKITQVESIGAKRLIQLEDMNTKRLRIRIIESDACPLLSEVGFYYGEL